MKKIGKRILSLLLAIALLLSTQVVVFAETVLAIDIATLPDKLTYTEGGSFGCYRRRVDGVLQREPGGHSDNRGYGHRI